MFETNTDLEKLQTLLDRSYESAGSHLLSIHSPTARLTAVELADRMQGMQGMQVFVVATVSRAGLPRTGPVDTFLFKGEFIFGTSPTAVRARHIARSPAISATHVRGESLVVTVHGNVRSLDLDGDDRGFGDFLREHYGVEHFDRYLAGGPYFAIVPEWMFAADMSVLSAGD